MAVFASDLKGLTGKVIALHVQNPDGTLDEFEGKVEAASANGIAFKPRGKSSIELYEPSQIHEYTIIPEPPKTIRQKKLRQPTIATSRQHLVDRHGMPLSKANAISDEDAFDLHDRIDHADLGHAHYEGEETSQERAISESDED